MPRLNLDHFCSLLNLFAPAKPLQTVTNETSACQNIWVVTALVQYSMLLSL